MPDTASEATRSNMDRAMQPSGHRYEEDCEVGSAEDRQGKKSRAMLVNIYTQSSEQTKKDSDRKIPVKESQ